MGLGDYDRFESLIAADRFVRTHLVNSLTVGAPIPSAKLEERRRMPGHGRQVERLGLEFDADQREQMVSLTVARPQDLVLPLGFFPTLPFHGLGQTQRRNKSGFEPLAPLVEKSAGALDAHIFDDLPDRSPQDQPRDQKANGQDAGPDQERHGQFPAHIPEMASDGLIVESERCDPQETDL